MASDKNSVLVEGFMVGEPSINTTHRGTSVCNFSIASNRYFKKGEGFDKEVSFFNVQCWANVASIAAEKGGKGTFVSVNGRLKQERWESAGKMQTRVIVIADNLEFNKKTNYEETQPETNASSFDSKLPF